MCPSPSVSYIPLPAQSHGSYHFLGAYCVPAHGSAEVTVPQEKRLAVFRVDLTHFCFCFCYSLCLQHPSHCPLGDVFKTHRLSEAFLDPHSQSLSSLPHPKAAPCLQLQGPFAHVLMSGGWRLIQGLAGLIYFCNPQDLTK